MLKVSPPPGLWPPKKERHKLTQACFKIRKAYITTGKKLQQAYTSANEKTRNAGGGPARGKRVKAGEEGGVFGGNILGGNPVEVTPMQVGSLLSSRREDPRGAS